MTLVPTRMEYRIKLAHVDRRLEVEEALIAALHPSETIEHLTLRVLAWCLLHEERIGFGAGLSDPDAPDLLTRDLTGRLTTWIECGSADGEKLRRVVQQNNGVIAHAVFDDERRKKEFVNQLAEWKRAAEIRVWKIDPDLVRALAAGDARRRKWTVTIVGDHLYVDADGESLDGAVTPSRAG